MPKGRYPFSKREKNVIMIKAAPHNYRLAALCTPCLSFCVAKTVFRHITKNLLD